MPIVSHMIERVLAIGAGIIVGILLAAMLCASSPAAAGAGGTQSPLERALGVTQDNLVEVAPSPTASSARALDTCAVPQAVAHRGGTETHTENTLQAYTDAWRYGLNEWETDIRFDVNNVPYLMHDATIDRTTDGTGQASAVNIVTTTVKMNDGQWLKDQTLDRLLELAAAKGATVAFEPKVVATSQQVGHVGLSLNTHGMRDQVLVDSFSTANLQPFKTAMPDLTYGLVSSNPLPVTDVAAVGPIFNVGAANLTQQWVDDYHAAGISVYVWTLDIPGQWAPYRTWGVDRYVTNRPQAYRGWRHWVCSGEAWAGVY